MQILYRRSILIMLLEILTKVLRIKIKIDLRSLHGCSNTYNYVNNNDVYSDTDNN